ncbi:MAG: DUF2103 domain-containing protein [Candidatus Moraniibacteriota bacterium]
MSNKNHIQGEKRGGKHTTIIDAAVEVVRYLQSLKQVSRVSPGYIRSGLKGGVKHRIKIIEEQGALLLKVRGGISFQEIRVYTSSPEKVQKIIEEKFFQ